MRPMTPCLRRTTIPAILISMSTAIVGGCEGEADEPVATVVRMISVPGCGDIASNSVCVCTGAQFTGDCFNFTNATRFYMNLSLAPYQTYNDNLSSVWVGPDAKAKFCQHPGGAGTCHLQVGQTPNGYFNYDTSLSCADNCVPECLTWCEQNNLTTSIRVDNVTDNCQSPGVDQIAIFEDPNYNQSNPARDCVVLNADTSGMGRYYPHPFANANSGQFGGGYGLNSDVISSVKVGSGGVSYRLWQHANATGAAFPSAGPSFVNAPTIGSGMDNQTTSIQVFP